MWMLSVLLGHSVMCAAPIHVIIGLRGAVNSFSALFMLEFFGVKESAVAVIPQCLSVLPMLMIFSGFYVEKRKNGITEGKEFLVLTRKETASIFGFSLIAALLEAVIFRLLAVILL